LDKLSKFLVFLAKRASAREPRTEEFKARLFITRDPKGYEFGPETGASALSPAERSVYEYLETHGGEADAEEIAEALGLSYDEVREIANSLMKKDYVERVD
jgi:DNA-binding MarR family transcriptional regulator